MDDFAIATAAPRPVTIGGTSFLVSKFTPRDLGDLQAWLKSRVPDPRLMARELCRDLPDAVGIEVWRDLAEQAKAWPPSIESVEGNQALTMTHEGAAQILWVLLRRHNAGVDLDRARQIADHVDFAELNLLIALGFPEPTFDPKARTATTESPDPPPTP